MAIESDLNKTELNSNDMNKVAGGNIDFIEQNGKCLVANVYGEFPDKDTAQKWVNDNAILPYQGPKPFREKTGAPCREPRWMGVCGGGACGCPPGKKCP